MTVHYQRILLSFFLFLLLGQASYGQSQEKKYAVMILNFAKGMQWPATASKGSFVIGVYEYPPLAAELNAIATSAKLGGRSVEIRELGSPEEIDNCHILFIPAYKTKRLPEILDIVQKRPILIVSNKPEYARKGAAINFVLVDGILKYEINSKSLEERGLKMSSNLKGLGIVLE